MHLKFTSVFSFTKVFKKKKKSKRAWNSPVHVNRSSTKYVDINLHSRNMKTEHNNNVALMPYMYMLLVKFVYK